MDPMRKAPPELLLKKLEEERKAHEEEMAKKATYKIQIWFTSDRRASEASFTISLWESGKRLHGGGDEMMFICRRHRHAPKVKPFEVGAPSDKVTSTGCNMPISGGLVNCGLVVCPHCQTKHKSDQIGDSVFYRTSMQKASEILADWWRKLECDADIYVKYSPMDPRVILMSRTMGPRKARELKGLTIYPLANIIKDTAVGATVESRFKALLEA